MLAQTQKGGLRYLFRWPPKKQQQAGLLHFFAATGAPSCAAGLWAYTPQ